MHDASIPLGSPPSFPEPAARASIAGSKASGAAPDEEVPRRLSVETPRAREARIQALAEARARGTLVIDPWAIADAILRSTRA